MINTYSSFLYNFEVTSNNKYLDFKEGAGAEITAELETGDFTLEDFMQNVEDAMNDVGSLTYSVTANRQTRIITISVASSTMNLLASTGTNVANGVWSLIGFVATDSGNVTTKSGTSAVGSTYSPQFKLQDYVSHEDFRLNRESTVSESASGLVRLHTFGIDRFIEMNIKFATNIYQPSGGPIINNQSGVDDLRSFMQFIMNKKSFEFIPDVDLPNTFHRVVLESSAGDSNGTGYKLQEQFTRGLAGYFETGIIKLRIIED